MKFLRDSLTLEAALSGAFEEELRCLCRHRGWDEQEIDGWIEPTTTSQFLKNIRPNSRLAAEKARESTVNIVLEELGNIEKMNT
jgi:hypothetical protein